MSDADVERAVDLYDELRRALSKETVLRLADYIASVELDLEPRQLTEPSRLREVVAALALEALGVTPQLIETLKTRRRGDPAQPPSLRSH